MSEPGPRHSAAVRMFLALCTLVLAQATLFALGFVLARPTGCSVTEANITPCLVHGIAIGASLHIFAMMGRQLIVGAGWLTIHPVLGAMRRRSRRNATAS